ncbi:MAG: hypothetical protein LQ338_008282 [Usnochroma carphineum]|nr:MAG: hypothetical protein LQ338_008282 [Usnochroma carphineum]
MVVTILILAIAASSAHDFTGIGCSVPSKLGYNVAASVLSFFVLLVLLGSTGPIAALRVIPWFIWGQLALDAFMFLIWIAAAGISPYNCNDICSACARYDEVWAGGLDCLCETYFYYKRDQSPVPTGLARSIEKRRYQGYKLGAGKAAGRIALDSIMVVLFAFTTAMGVFWFLKNRRSGAASSSAPAAQPTGPAAAQQSGNPGAVQTTQVYPEKTDAPYTNQPLQQGTYPPQGQPQVQPYPEQVLSTQPGTYATPGPQGSVGEYYNQPPQSQPRQTAYPPNHAEMQSHPGEPPRDQTVSPVSHA